MLYVHFTLHSSWKKIQEDGFIHPPNVSRIPGMFRDPNKVCAYKNFEINNEDLISRVIQFICESKNETPRCVPLRFHDFIMLLIEENPDVDWVEFPREKREMLNNKLIFEADLQKIGIYVKTDDSIPVKYVTPKI
jgi:hypothetical protein